MSTIGELIKHLKGYPADMPCAYSLWLPDDVKGLANQKGQTVDEEMVANVLESVNENQDCSLGISWDTLDFYLQEEIRENEIGECPLCGDSAKLIETIDGIMCHECLNDMVRENLKSEQYNRCEQLIGDALRDREGNADENV